MAASLQSAKYSQCSRFIITTSSRRWTRLGLCMAAMMIFFNFCLPSRALYRNSPRLEAIFSHRYDNSPQYYPSPSHYLQTYGNGSYMDSITASTNLSEKAISMRQQCKDSLLETRIATATAHFFKPNNPETFYQQSLRSHLLHNIIHDTQLHILSTPIINSVWNKQAFIQLLVLNELVKPPQERLEWIFWADRDTVILDYCRSPASLIAREIRSNNENTGTTHGPDVNLLITNDHNGLMAGIFIIRVCEWSVKFLSDVLAFRTFKPSVDLRFHEQTAMELLLKEEDKYKDNVAYIPQHWMSNYRGDTAESFLHRSDASGMADWMVRRGDFMVHFAGSGDKNGNIMEYAGIGEEVFDAIQGGDILRNVSAADIEQFWEMYKKN